MVHAASRELRPQCATVPRASNQLGSGSPSFLRVSFFGVVKVKKSHGLAQPG